MNMACAWCERGLCMIGCLPTHPPCKPREGVGGGPEAGEQIERTLSGTDKERTESSRSDVRVTHGRRDQKDVRINPKCLVIDSGEEN